MSQSYRKIYFLALALQASLAFAQPRIHYTERLDAPTEKPDFGASTFADFDAGQTSSRATRNSAHRVSQFNGVHFEGPFTLRGDWDLREIRERDPWGHVLRWIYDRQGLKANQFGSFFLRLPSEAGESYLLDTSGRPKAHHDLWYGLGSDSSGTPLYGIKILPISNRRDEGTAFDAYPPITQVPDLRGGQDSTVPVVGSTELDNALAEYYYRDEKGKGIPYYAPSSTPRLLGRELPTRTPVSGSEIEAEMRFQSDSEAKYPLLAIMGYTRPNKWVGSLAQLGNIELLKTQGGFEHMGAYRGFGRQLDAPVDLYRGALGVLGEPAIAYGLRLRKANAPGVFEDSATVNQNVLIAMLLINKGKGGVIFPTRADFTRDYLKAVNLREVFSFYRGWLDPTWVREEILSESERAELAELRRSRQEIPDRFTFYFKLRNDEVWFNYCSEYVTLAYNVGLNLIHHLRGFEEVYGPTVGRELFSLASEEYKKITGRELPTISEKAFRPLYSDAIDFRRHRQMPIIDRPESLELNQGLVWPMQSLSDLIKSFMASYARWIDLGAERSALVLMNFADESVQRSGAPIRAFLAYAVPVVTSAFFFELLSETYQSSDEVDLGADLEKRWLRVQAQLQLAGLDAFAPTNPGEALLRDEVSRMIEIYATSNKYREIYRQRRELLRSRYKGQSLEARRALYVSFENDIRPYLKEARLRAREASGVAFYSLPAILQQILNGQHYVNRRVEVAVIGTVMHASEVQKVLATRSTATGEAFFQRDSQSGL